jgi:hypothetical protein
MEPVDPAMTSNEPTIKGLRKDILKEKQQCPKCKAWLSRRFLQYRHRCASLRPIDIEALREELERRSRAGFERRVSAKDE